LVGFELPRKNLGSDDKSLGTQSGSRAGEGKWLPGPMGLMVKAPVGISGAQKGLTNPAQGRWQAKAKESNA